MRHQTVMEKRSFPEHAAPDGDGSYFQSQSKQIGAQHAGRKSKQADRSAACRKEAGVQGQKQSNIPA